MSADRERCAPEVFLAFADADRARARELRGRLEAMGIAVFRYARSLQVGDRWAREIAEALRASKLVVVLLSDASKSSHFTVDEIAQAIGLTPAPGWERRVCPLYLDKMPVRADLGVGLARMHALEVGSGGLESVARAIFARLDRPRSVPDGQAPRRAQRAGGERRLVVRQEPLPRAYTDLRRGPALTSRRAALIGIGLLLWAGALAWRARPPALVSLQVARPAMVPLAGARFLMGSAEDEKGRDPDETLHEVEISPLWVSQTEISQTQFTAVLRREPAPACAVEGFVGAAFPAVCVSWLETVEYCNELSRREGLDPVYAIDGSDVRWDRNGNGYRLLSEAEWEYAARAGTHTRWVGTDAVEQVCLYGNVAIPFPCEDGYWNLAAVDEPRYRANAFGLLGIGGNVSEWVWDGYSSEYPASEAGPVLDPVSPETGMERVIRGASWFDVPQLARVANRCGAEASGRYAFVGFRIARSALPSQPDHSPGP